MHSEAAAVLKNFANVTGKQHETGKHMKAFRPATLLKRDSYTGFFCEICEILKNTEEHQRTTASVY